MRLAILTSRIRVEEKLLVDALRRRAIAFDIIDDGELLLNPTAHRNYIDVWRATPTINIGVVCPSWMIRFCLKPGS